MKRVVGAAIVAVAAGVVFASCGGSPSGPTTGGNGGNGGGGGVITQPNTPPVVKSIAASTTRVEVDTPVTLTAIVEDAETPIANMSFAWEFPGGSGSATGTGNGSTISWTPGAALKTPGDFTITVTVTERYTSNGAQAENKASGTTTLHINNSPKELAEMSLRFLGDFADSRVSPEKCVSEFSDSCSGKKNEFADIVDNRHDFLILSSTLRSTRVDYVPGQSTATAHTFCGFTSQVITRTPQSGGCVANPDSCKFDSVQSVQGDCLTTNVYEKGRWWICTSSFKPEIGVASPFTRAFFGLAGDAR